MARIGTLDEPLLLIDVDGVLNPYLRADDPVPDGYAEHSIDGVRVLLSPRHGDWMRELAQAYKLGWASSWEADCDTLIGRVIGAPQGMPFLTFVERDDKDWLWKLPAVERFVGDRAVAWLDDAPGQGADDWARNRQAPTLLVQPDPRIGWTLREYELLLDFAANQARLGA
jgi:hypothetical protein